MMFIEYSYYRRNFNFGTHSNNAYVLSKMINYQCTQVFTSASIYSGKEWRYIRGKTHNVQPNSILTTRRHNSHGVDIVCTMTVSYKYVIFGRISGPTFPQRSECRRAKHILVTAGLLKIHVSVAGKPWPIIDTCPTLGTWWGQYYSDENPNQTLVRFLLCIYDRSLWKHHLDSPMICMDKHTLCIIHARSNPFGTVTDKMSRSCKHVRSQIWVTSYIYIT